MTEHLVPPLDGSEGRTDVVEQVRVARPRNGPLVYIIVGAVVLGVIGLVAAQWIKSPQQRLAETSSPPATELTEQVERRVLKDNVVARGQVTARTTFEVTPGTTAVSRSVVTGIRTSAGAAIKEGAVLIEVAGRPVFALPGDIPAYRDLRPGDSGRDVAQLQRALKKLGFRVDDRTGSFQAGTKEALRDFYRSIGYDVPTTGADDDQAVDAANETVRQTERAYDEAKDAVQEAADGAAKKEAQKLLEYAEQDLAHARSEQVKLVSRTGPMLPVSEVVYLPSFPGRVEKLNASIGGDVKAPALTVSCGDLVVNSQLNPAQRGLLRVGMKVEISSDLSNVQYHGVISSIGDLQQDESGARSHKMVVSPVGRKLGNDVVGADLRLTIEAASTGDEVLVVPVTALYSSSSGETTIRRRDGDKVDDIIVRVGVTAGGYASITPVSGDLAEGDLVVVGRG